MDPGLCLLTVLFASLTFPVIFLPTETVYSSDETLFHVPAVRQIRQEWPRLDLREDSLSATAPGYQYFLATLSLVTGDSLRTLRLLNCLVSFLVLVSLYLYVRRGASPGLACLIVLPLAASNFFVKSSCWVVTDNAGLLLTVWALIALFLPGGGLLRGGGIGALAAAATFVRQLNVWLVGPALARAWFVPAVPAGRAARARPFAAAALPTAVIACLYLAWGGLVPEQWRSKSYGFSLCPIAFLLAVFAVFGPWYLSLAPPESRRAWWGPWPVVGFAVGILAALASPTTFDHEEGRWGAYFWAAVERLPAAGERSLFFAVLSPLGGAVLAIFGVELFRAAAPWLARLWLVAVAAWASTFLINRQVFHRYFEPLALVFLIFAVTAMGVTGHRGPGRSGRLALLSLSALQLAITLLTLYRILSGMTAAAH
jgi:hypothetical protein